jgi:hypothetical protein
MVIMPVDRQKILTKVRKGVWNIFLRISFRWLPVILNVVKE